MIANKQGWYIGYALEPNDSRRKIKLDELVEPGKNRLIRPLNKEELCKQSLKLIIAE